MANPSACGYPDVENTGTSGALEAVAGEVSLSTAGQVYENKLVHGCVTVTAPNVTIRNVKIDGFCTFSIRARPSEGNTGGLVVVDTEIDLAGNVFNFGLEGGNYTLRRVLIHNGSDCGATSQNVVIEDTLCSLGPDTDDDGWADSRAFCDTVDAGPGDGHPHYDGFQTFEGANQTFRHNTIRNPCQQTSAISIGTNSGGVSNVLVEDNLLAGGGYSLYCNGSDAEDTPNEVVRNNRFSKALHPSGGYFGPTHHCNVVNEFTGNVWDDTGEPLR
jgi:hypothetical protein